MRIWLILFLSLDMVELAEGFLDISWHIQVDLSFLIVPVEVDADVSYCACPIRCYFVVLLEDVFQMFCMFDAFVFDTEIVHNESERDWSCFMFPKSWHQLALKVSILVNPFLHLLHPPILGIF